MRLIALLGLLVAKLFAADQTAFSYDKSLPLDTREHEVAIRSGIRITLLNVAVAPMVRVDCVLVTPLRAKARTGAIIWMHSGGFFEQLPDAMLMAQAGAVSLLINPITPEWACRQRLGASPWRRQLSASAAGSISCYKEATSTHNAWDLSATAMVR